MPSPVKINYKVYQGSTFRETFRWESSTRGYANISAISKAAPCVVTTSTAHQIPLGWRAKVTGVLGMKEINSDEYRLVTDKTSTSVTFNEINAANYSQYLSGGVLEWNVPISLIGFTGRMQIRPSQDSSTIIKELTSANGGILIDTSLNTITVEMIASDTQSFTFNSAVYSLELVRGSEVVPFVTGNLTLVKEITR